MPKLKLSLKQDQISGFSFSFTKVLTLKLGDLLKNDRVFEEGNAKSSDDDRTYHSKTKIAETVISYLTEQIRTSSDDTLCVQGIQRLIDLSEEFLSSFEEEIKT